MYFNQNLNSAEFYLLKMLVLFILIFTAIETTFGAVLCYPCGDYVYDEEFEAIAKKHKLQAARITGKILHF